LSDLIEQIIDQLNLRWAWEKVRRAAIPGDIWVDESEVAGFELDLEMNLRSIADEIKKNHYSVSPIRPIPFPKNKTKDGVPQVRQCFYISIRDQVAWTAVVNIVGPYVDKQMPVWSYGNRLYRSIWVDEDDDGQARRKIGNYRHSSGLYYLPFRQSWPIYRRHIFLATRAMGNRTDDQDKDDLDFQEYELQQRLKEEYKCPFLFPEYWQGKRPNKNTKDLFWCGIDLKKFYPSINLSAVRQNIIGCLPDSFREQANTLLESMLLFPLETNNWGPIELSALSIKSIGGNYRHIPTGLYVAGFLANAGLLSIDKQVSNEFGSHHVAHFRYVDDHVILAFDFDSLVAWFDKYLSLIKNARIGINVNYEKVEPPELARYLLARKKKLKHLPDLKESAKIKCALDPEFPSPLMTKTIALVSNIARTDFNLLEQVELDSLTEQLEHLLLVDLSEEEIPAKTRISFAAGRLTKIAECRLANPVESIGIQSRIALINSALRSKELNDQEREQLTTSLAELEEKFTAAKDVVHRDVYRIFQLLRKVLRERPDRTRLWTRAILMCRLTGVDGLRELLEDIEKVVEDKIEGQLTYEALLANFLSVVSNQLIVAARTSQQDDIPSWKKDAALAFVQTTLSLRIDKPRGNRWFLNICWKQYCFSIYCASIILQKVDSFNPSLFPSKLLKIGKDLLDPTAGGKSLFLVWWATRRTLLDLNIFADGLVKSLASEFPASQASLAFWSFYPLDLPDHLLESFWRHQLQSNWGRVNGRLFDAFRNRKLTELPNDIATAINVVVSRQSEGTISLYDWCSFLNKLPNSGINDPRNSEWSFLEITNQAISLISRQPKFGLQYIEDQINLPSSHFCVHPANFRLPIGWTVGGRESPELSWAEWKGRVQSEKLEVIPIGDCIYDQRYTPLVPDQTSLFTEINSVRGVGLLLYGLLKCSFDLPTIWNGPGHSDLLSMLPKLLLQEMTCSSWTLGILQGCLSSRANESRFIKRYQQVEAYDDDTLADPIRFDNLDDVSRAVSHAQRVLEGYQMATLQYNARQLIPIRIRQLTRDYNWQQAFTDIEATNDAGK
jgi:hypothetical protein